MGDINVFRTDATPVRKRGVAVPFSLATCSRKLASVKEKAYGDRAVLSH